MVFVQLKVTASTFLTPCCRSSVGTSRSSLLGKTPASVGISLFFSPSVGTLTSVIVSGVNDRREEFRANHKPMMIWRSGNIKSRLVELKKAADPKGNPCPYSKYNLWLSVLQIQRLIKNTELGRLAQSWKTNSSHEVKNEPVRKVLAIS